MTSPKPPANWPFPRWDNGKMVKPRNVKPKPTTPDAPVAPF